MTRRESPAPCHEPGPNAGGVDRSRTWAPPAEAGRPREGPPAQAAGPPCSRGKSRNAPGTSTGSGSSRPAGPSARGCPAPRPTGRAPGARPPAGRPRCRSSAAGLPGQPRPLGRRGQARIPVTALGDHLPGCTMEAPARTPTRRNRDGGSPAHPGRPGPRGVVRAVAAANPNTVVVNAGSPVELPWRDEVAAVLLGWFPGQEGGAALADVLTGAHEPGGRLPTTSGSLADALVTQVVPTDGELRYEEGVFIGYAAWEKAGRTPSYPFGHGLGHTDWAYESLDVDGTTVRVRLRHTGERPGREVVQIYVAPAGPGPERPARRLAAFAAAEAAPGESTEVTVELPRRAFEVWDETAKAWACVKGSYEIAAGRSIADQRLTAPINV
ncbi:hypothetical protein D9753_24570 [Streptomyces dangxiongensis]|uniref:Fibronectin type III-like domain-containing protein n=1 Tax=Streptomyces dangxiongensis TaxID=1442032 RepID=A0A3G2JGN0_9ACTN|nr:hypothetical protein D9753_24570 [Streptomyces dangxiongensis]